jgi:hypothetical protein
VIHEGTSLLEVVSRWRGGALTPLGRRKVNLFSMKTGEEYVN